MLRTHTCGELRACHVGQTVTLCGWVDSGRDHGGAVFLDIRDRYGKTQVIVGPEASVELVRQAVKFRAKDRLLHLTSNDPKLSDGGRWRGPCMVGGKAAAEARAVTAVAVRCSDWFGRGV